jgi:hypothetical protein
VSLVEILEKVPGPWRRFRALTEQLPRPVALAGGFEAPTGGSALSAQLIGSVDHLFMWLRKWSRRRNAATNL